MEVTMHRHALDYGVTMAVKLDRSEILCSAMPAAIMAKIAQSVADKYVEEHYAEIAARLDQNAIANSAIAEAGKKIAEEIQRKPNIVHEVENHTEVYQRGVFGGLKRI